MNPINLRKGELSSHSGSNMTGSEVKDQFVSPLSSKHLCHFSFCTFNKQKVLIP